MWLANPPWISLPGIFWVVQMLPRSRLQTSQSPQGMTAGIITALPSHPPASGAAAVTMPSSASLGGGGICLAFDAEAGEVRALDFLARPPRRPEPGADRPTAVPGNVRGFFALHARYGRLAWSQVLGPAEGLARFGVRVSRAFARDLEQVEDALMVEPNTRLVFAVADGSRIVREGDYLRQPELAPSH